MIAHSWSAEHKRLLIGILLGCTALVALFWINGGWVSWMNSHSADKPDVVAGESQDSSSTSNIATSTKAIHSCPSLITDTQLANQPLRTGDSPLFPGLEWTELSPIEAEQYKHSALYVQGMDGAIEPEIRLEGKAWAATHERSDVRDPGIERELEKYYSDLFAREQWHFSQYVHGYSISGIAADHPTGAASMFGHVQVHNGMARVITIAESRRLVRDPATAEENFAGEIIGASSTTYVVFVSDPVSLATIIPEYVPAAFLGIGYNNIAYASSTHRFGLKVVEVVPNSPANNANIHEGDILLALDGIGFDAQHELVSLIQQKCPGDTITLRILADNDKVDKTITLGSY